VACSKNDSTLPTLYFMHERYEVFPALGGAEWFMEQGDLTLKKEGRKNKKRGTKRKFYIKYNVSTLLVLSQKSFVT
jgi:hypothetical protein